MKYSINKYSIPDKIVKIRICIKIKENDEKKKEERKKDFHVI